MKIAVIHNAYRDRGGEDTCVENELEALRAGNLSMVSHVLKTPSAFDASLDALGAPLGLREEAQLESWLRQEKPDLLHAHNLFPLFSPRLFRFAKTIGIQTVQTLHNFRPLCLNGLFMTPSLEICERCAEGNYLPGIVRGCYRGERLQSAGMAAHLSAARKRGWYDAVDRFIAPSAFLKQRYVAYGFPEARITVQPHFLSQMPPDAPAEASDYILYLGRLSEEKGVRWLLGRFASSDHSTKLIVAGDGPLRGLVEAAVSSRVEFAGTVSGTRKADLLRRASALVLSSECYENFPMAVLEANALGTPALLSRHGGLGELGAQNGNATFTPHDERSFWDSFQALRIRTGSMSQRLTIQAQTRDRYGRDRFLERRRALYESLALPV